MRERWTLGALAVFAATGAGGGGTAAKPPQPGQAAPDFTAAASTGKTIKLADFSGKKTVVLAFFPKVFTPG
jgi:peroxiredoxin Q/BCP